MNGLFAASKVATMQIQPGGEKKPEGYFVQGPAQWEPGLFVLPQDTFNVN